MLCNHGSDIFVMVEKNNFAHKRTLTLDIVDKLVFRWYHPEFRSCNINHVNMTLEGTRKISTKIIVKFNEIPITYEK